MSNITTMNIDGIVYLMDRATAKAIVRARNAEQVEAVLFFQQRNGGAKMIGRL